MIFFQFYLWQILKMIRSLLSDLSKFRMVFETCKIHYSASQSIPNFQTFPFSEQVFFVEDIEEDKTDYGLTGDKTGLVSIGGGVDSTSQVWNGDFTLMVGTRGQEWIAYVWIELGKIRREYGIDRNGMFEESS